MIYLLLILITFIHGDVITRTLFIYFNYGPVYYNFFSYREKNNYSSAVQLVNKLYPFKAMAQATNLNWQVPFPINM